VVVQLLRSPWARPAVQLLSALQAHLEVQHKLQIPGMVSLLAAGRHGDSLYWVSEQAPGRPLSAQVGRLGFGAAMSTARTILGILLRAQQSGISHLALRPSQVLMSARTAREPQLLLCGLGLAAILQPPVASFAAEAQDFLAPEIRSAPQGFAATSRTADVYSLAMILRWLFGLRGDPQKTQVSSGGIPTPLFALLTEMLAHDPRARPTLLQVHDRLRSILSEASSSQELRPRSLLPADSGSAESLPSLSSSQIQPSLPGLSIRDALSSPGDSPSSSDPLIGQLFGSFRLLRRLGEGGMGTVYEATHTIIGYRAAVKVLHPHFTSNREYSRRFLDEAKAVNIVEHPGIVSIFDFGQRDDGSLYIVMEYLRGRTLEALLSRNQRGLPVELAIELMDQLTQAIAAAHQKEIVHRDIKPANVMLLDDPLLPGALRVKILDFGIAKLSGRGGLEEARTAGDQTGFGQMLGTPMYMAPEQYGDAAEVKGKADVFASGAVFFQLLTGNPPFGQTSSFRVVGEPAPRVASRQSSVPPALDQLVADMLQAKAEDRPEMAVVCQRLQQLRRTPQKRRRGLVGVGLSAVATGVAITALFVRTPKERDPYPEFVAARTAALQHLTQQVQTGSAVQRHSAIQQLSRARESDVAESLRQLVVAEPLGSAVWQAAVVALGELQDYSARPLLRQQLSSLPSSDKQSCEWVQNHQTSRLQLLLASSLLRLRDPSGSHTLGGYLRCYPQERPGLALDAALQLFWSADEQTRELQPPPWLALRSPLSRVEDNLPNLERTLRVLGDREQDELLRWLRGQDGLSPKSSLQVRGLLARFGDMAAHKSLEQLASPDSPRKYEASQMLLIARPGDVELCALVREGLAKSRRDDERRDFLGALALCPQLDTVQLLSSLLRDAAAPALLRDQAAGSLLQILPPTEKRLVAVSDELVALCQSPLAADQARCLEAMIEKEDRGVAALLRSQLTDASDEVRLAAVRVLGRSRLKQELDTLRLALQDANTDVRVAGQRAIVEILDSIDNPQASVPALLRQKLTELAESGSGDAQVRLIAQVILLRLHDQRFEPAIAQVMQSSDEKLRRLLVEVLPRRHPILVTALGDSAESVRTFAAHRLAESGDKRAVPVLQALLKGRGSQVLLAYMDLRRLGVRVEEPPQLFALLRTRDLALRFAAVQTLRYLSPKEAVRYLMQLAYDPADVVRKEVVRCAAELFRKERLPVLRLVLERFLQDEALAVRLLARRLHEDLGLTPGSKVVTAPSATAADSARRGSDSAATASSVRDAGIPTATPTPIPTTIPTPIPTAIPTPIPTAIPTPIPTAIPTAVPTFSQSVDAVRTALRTQSPGAARQQLSQLRRRPSLAERERHDLELLDVEISIAEYQSGGRTPLLLEPTTRKLNALFLRSRSGSFAESHKQRLATLYEALRPSVVTVRYGVLRDGRCIEMGITLLPGAQMISGKLWRGGSEVTNGCDPRK
jgi:serine/threonine protein kinase